MHQFSSFYSLLVHVFQKISLEEMQSILKKDNHEWFLTQIAAHTWKAYLESQLLIQRSRKEITAQIIDGTDDKDAYDQLHKTHSSKLDALIKLVHMLLFLAIRNCETQDKFQKVYVSLVLDSSEFPTTYLMLGSDFDLSAGMPIFFYQADIIDKWREFLEVAGENSISRSLESVVKSFNDIGSNLMAIMDNILKSLEKASKLFIIEKLIQINDVIKLAKEIMMSIVYYSDLSQKPYCFEAILTDNNRATLLQHNLPNAFNNICNRITKILNINAPLPIVYENDEENDAESDAEKSPPASPSP
jgi:hypothetical protein